MAEMKSLTVGGIKFDVVDATAARQTDLEAERARIDSLTALEEGSTTGDAELQDIRIGFDGTEYQTAGSAVRAQIRQAMESAGSGGISSTAAALLVTILKNAVFTSVQSANIIALEAALASGGGTGGGTTIPGYYTVINVLTNCTNSNSTTSIAEGGSYEANISVNSSCKLTSISVYMGGVDVTSTAYSNGVISISAVTGDIVITATAVTTETVEEVLEPFWCTDYDNTTFEYTVITDTTSANQYVTAVWFRSTIGGGVVYVTIDPAYLDFVRCRLLILDSEGNAYKVAGIGNTQDTPTSGDITSSVTLYDPGVNRYLFMNGSWSYTIPDGCNVLVEGYIEKAHVVDETFAATAKPQYTMVDAITFDGVGFTAKVVKEG